MRPNRAAVKTKWYSVVTQLLILVLCLSTAALILTDTGRPKAYSLLWILPLVYMIVSFILLAFVKIVYLPIVTILFLAMYAARMVIVPLSLFLGRYATFAIEEVITPTMLEALLLISWEFFALTLLLCFLNFCYHRSSAKWNTRELASTEKIGEPLPSLLVWLLIFGVLLFVLIMFGTPNFFRANFFTVLGPSETVLNLRRSQLVSENAFGLRWGSLLITLALKIFWVLHILVPPVLIRSVYRYVKSHRISTILTVLIILLATLISTEYRSNSIQVGLSVLLAAKLVYQQKLRVSLVVISLLLGLLALSGLAIKSAHAVGDFSFFSGVSHMLSSYFNGPQYLATAIAASRENSQLGLHQLPWDLIERLPLGSRFLLPSFVNSSKIYNQYFGERYLGMILPSIGMGYTYFGFAADPVVPAVALVLSAYFESKSKYAPNLIWKALNIMGVVMFCRAMAMSNMLSGVTYMVDYAYAWFVLYISDLFERWKNTKNLFGKLK